MSGQRLKTQFQRLYSHFSGEDSDTNLQDIADVLFCTRRNVRMVINKMVEKGWIDWQPAVGRGKQSRLIFFSSDSELQYTHARKLVAEGKLEQALTALDDNADKLAQLIQEQLGLTTLQGKQVVRLPYYRPLLDLNSLHPIRRTERHLVRQVFNGLTRINEEKEEVEGDLAHHWEMKTSKHWRFYLRPAVRFHDGKLLESTDVIATLQQVKLHRLFSHIKTVESPFANTIDIHLSQDDHHLPYLLADSLAMIQPADASQRKDFERYPVGTGPYKVAVNDKHCLKLEAHDHYFGFRALIDIVDIWILPDHPSCYLLPTTQLDAKNTGDISGHLTLAQGSNYLLFNRNSGLAQSDDWLAYFQHRFAPLNILRLLDMAKIGDYRLNNAYGLLPGWAHIRPAANVDKPPARRVVTLAYQQQHHLYPVVADTMKQILAADGVKLKTLEMTTREIMEGKHAEKIDMWLEGVTLGSHRNDALLSWIYHFDQIKRVMPEVEFTRIEHAVTYWRANPEQDLPAKQLGAELVHSGQILPMFYNWVGVESGQLQDMAANAMGWFDFKSVWVKPELGINSVSEQ